MVTFIIADNQDITREGLHGYIHALYDEPHIVDVENRKALLEALTRFPHSVVVLDYTLFDLNGMEDIFILRARYSTMWWVLFSNELSEDLIRKLCVAGGVSIVLKENSADEIRLALSFAQKGEKYLCHQISGLLAGGFSGKTENTGLTATEVEILKLIAKGESVKEMAVHRCSSVHTIITHKKNIFRKIGVNNVYEATKYALRAGLLEMMEYYI